MFSKKNCKDCKKLSPKYIYNNKYFVIYIIKILIIINFAFQNILLDFFYQFNQIFNYKNTRLKSLLYNESMKNIIR